MYKLRVGVIILYVVSTICFFVLSHYLLQGIAAFLSVVSILIFSYLDIEKNASVERRIKQMLVPMPFEVVMEDEPPDIEVMYG